MLALPIATALSGFFTSCIVLVLSWLAMWLTGLYVVEANLPLADGANYISMTYASLGKLGKYTAWITYILLLYSLMAAYLSGGGGIFVKAVSDQFQIHWPLWTGPIPWVIIMGAIVYLGVSSADRLNRLLFTGLIVTFIFLLVVTLPHLQVKNLDSERPSVLYTALPIILTSFGYHVIIPSLRSYLDSRVKRLTLAVLIGSLLPLLVYLLWETAIFGSLSHGHLLSILHSGQPATQLTVNLADQLNNSWVLTIAELFIFFAIASSFLGISLSLFDFLADAFKIKKTHLGRLYILLLTFAPPLIYTWLYPKGFILALSYAGIFVAILHGILPALMVLCRRLKKLPSPYRAPGGYVGMIIILLFSGLVILSQVVVNVSAS